MELLGGLPLPLALAVLALVDGLSVGTLLIPVFLLLSPGRVRSGRILLYLGTIAAFYLLVGLLFLWGLVNLVDVASGFLASPAGIVTRLVVGVGLVIVAFAMPTGPTEPTHRSPARAVASASVTTGSSDHEAATPTETYGAPSGRVTRWRERLLDPRTRRAAVMAVAITAGLVEVATMLPYILAMTMLADAGVSTPFRVLSLVAYCLLMVAPALVLLALRVVAAPLVQRPLERFAAWMQRTGAENTAWLIGIIGFLVARSAAAELGVFDALDGMLGR